MRIVLYCSIVIVSFFLQCTYSNSNQEKRADIYGGTLHIAFDSKNIHLYPPMVVDESEKQIVYQVHRGLFQYNPRNETLMPSICKSWDVDNTGNVYLFHLDSTVYFHNDVCFTDGKGRQVTAYDVEYSFYLLATYSSSNKNFTSTVSRIKGAKEYYKESQKNPNTNKLRIEGIEVIHKYLIKITLESPSAYFVYNLAHPSASILPREAIQKYGTASKVGAGPFMFKYQIDTIKIALARNPNFFLFDDNGLQLPYLDEVHFSYVSDFEKAQSLFVQKKLSALLFVNHDEVPEFVGLYTDSISYKLIKSMSHSSSKNMYYNIVDESVQQLYTNNLRILELSQVFFSKN